MFIVPRTETKAKQLVINQIRTVKDKEKLMPDLQSLTAFEFIGTNKFKLKQNVKMGKRYN